MVHRMTSVESNPGRWQWPTIASKRRWLSGVAAGIAEELGVEALWVRLAFVLLTAASGVGIVVYSVAWFGLWRLSLQSGRVRRAPVPKGATEARATWGVVSLSLGVYLVVDQWIPDVDGRIAVWPVVLAAFGMLLAWSTDRVDWEAPGQWLRAVAGLLLVAMGVVAFIGANLSSAATPAALWVTLAVISGVVLTVAPWLWRVASHVGQERLARLQADERAEVAAHLHDSVLQTLSLIVRNARDGDAVVRLARHQERELRQWLYGRKRDEGQRASFRTALTALAAEVEQWHEVPIEVVVVGDGPVTAPVQALLAAAREAMTNASKHSGAERVDVFGEWLDGRVEVYVRDTGRGFAMEAVQADRQGIAQSIVARLQRAGGVAQIVSQPGQGTEVSLQVQSLADESTAADTSDAPSAEQSATTEA